MAEENKNTVKINPNNDTKFSVNFFITLTKSLLKYLLSVLPVYDDGKSRCVGSLNSGKY